MRVRATASGNHHSNAIGQVELSCTPAGLALGLFGVGPYREGYAVGALSSGTRFTIPYHCISAARAYGDQLQLQFEMPGFPHDRLTLTRFTAGPGVPLGELRRRRLILHLGALSFAALACLAAAVVGPILTRSQAAGSALGYGLGAGAIVLALGYALDHTFFVMPPGEEATRKAFVHELSAYVASLVSSETAYEAPRAARTWDISHLIPRMASAVGITLGALILTGLVLGERLITRIPPPSLPSSAPEPQTMVQQTSPPITTAEPQVPPAEPSRLPPADQSGEPPAPSGDSVAEVERKCLCDRADSVLWKTPIPRLSALLIERRTVPTKTHVRTQLELAVINNSDTPLNEITVHVQFYEQKGGKLVPTKERPLYFEGPLRPGHAIKWSAEARGTSYEILVPEFGQLGPNGDGAAPAEAFVDLLNANHRPVRLHAARILSYLGDDRAREAALRLKDAMRAAEGPYLRRILMATGEVRVCDTETGQKTLGACIYNATEQELSGLGVQLNLLSTSLDVQQPLADPPELRASQKWSIPTSFPAQTGHFVRVTLPGTFGTDQGSSLELLADRYDLLD